MCGKLDKFLKQQYDDYMQLPPVEKQERNCYLAYDLGERQNKEAL